MEFHPRDLPISKTYNLKDEKDAANAVKDMVDRGFKGKKDGYKVLMPKEPKVAKRIGYHVTTGITAGLGQKNKDRNIKYWTYHDDDGIHYAIVLIHGDLLTELGF